MGGGAGGVCAVGRMIKAVITLLQWKHGMLAPIRTVVELCSYGYHGHDPLTVDSARGV